MGKDGLYYQDSRESGYIKVNKIIAKNATGAGDALSAALAYSLDEGWSIKESALFAVSAAQIAINSEDVVNDELNIRKIEEVMMEIKKLN